MNQLRAILASILFLNFFMFAQESANEDVEEVIVTAQKKEEGYVDVPVSETTKVDKFSSSKIAPSLYQLKIVSSRLSSI